MGETTPARTRPRRLTPPQVVRRRAARQRPRPRRVCRGRDRDADPATAATAAPILPTPDPPPGTTALSTSVNCVVMVFPSGLVPPPGDRWPHLPPGSTFGLLAAPEPRLPAAVAGIVAEARRRRALAAALAGGDPPLTQSARASPRRFRAARGHRGASGTATTVSVGATAGPVIVGSATAPDWAPPRKQSPQRRLDHRPGGAGGGGGPASSSTAPVTSSPTTTSPPPEGPAGRSRSPCPTVARMTRRSPALTHPPTLAVLTLKNPHRPGFIPIAIAARRGGRRRPGHGRRQPARAGQHSDHGDRRCPQPPGHHPRRDRPFRNHRAPSRSSPRPSDLRRDQPPATLVARSSTRPASSSASTPPSPRWAPASRAAAISASGSPYRRTRRGRSPSSSSPRAGSATRTSGSRPATPLRPTAQTGGMRPW